MRRQRMIATLCAAALAAVAPAVAQAQQPAAMKGMFTLDRQASDNVNAAIDAAVRPMNFVTRPIARGRLRKTNVPYERVVIDFNAQQVSVVRDALPAIVTPANGTAVKWTREDGEVFDVSTRWEGGALVQSFVAEDGSRTNTFSLSPDGGTLTMQVRIESPRLSQPLQYKLVFTRA